MPEVDSECLLQPFLHLFIVIIKLILWGSRTSRGTHVEIRGPLRNLFLLPPWGFQEIKLVCKTWPQVP